MYEFSDYFNIFEKDTPYRTAAGELEDYFRFLDMVLEGYSEHKGLGKESKLFSRGLVITESEMEKYFSMPPRLRKLDACDPVLAAAAEDAWHYIRSRVAATLGPAYAGDSEELLTDADDAYDSEELLTDADDAYDPEELLTDADDALDPDGSSDIPDGFREEDDADDEEPGENEPVPEGMLVETGILWIESIKSIFDLDQTGVMAVVMALASALDRRYERIFGFLQDDISRTRPTIGLLNALMGRITPRYDDEELPAGLLDEDLFTSLFVDAEEDLGLNTELVLNPLLIRILMGQPDREEHFPEALTLYHEDPDIPVFFEKSAEELSFALKDTGNVFCYAENADEETVLHLMYGFTQEMAEPLYVLDLRQLLTESFKESSACLSNLALRLRLGNGLLCVRMIKDEAGEAGHEKEMAARRWKLLNRLSRLCQYRCIVIFGEEKEPGELIVKSVPFLHIPAPDVHVRTAVWTYFLDPDQDSAGISEDVDIPDLADCYDISYGMIKNVCSHVKAAARIRSMESVDRNMVLDSLRQLNQVNFYGLASYVQASYTWEDIHITDEQRDVLQAACDRYRLRNRIGQGWGLTRKNAYGNGVSLLLYGPPGTGKTMAAQVVANELGIPLYRVDISQIFSKYIGETEKNLSVIFNAVRGANVILFFDEADALFSKRTEISNSNDKYANSETAYLLQKIEEYDGMSILATNHYNNFDTAFVRRITYSVRLDSPDEEARFTLWTTMLPLSAKTEPDIPFRFLAKKFELSGANIKAILFSAAYMAGAEQEPVGMKHIVRAMEYEYRKLGRFIDREAFGPYAKYLGSAGKTEG